MKRLLTLAFVTMGLSVFSQNLFLEDCFVGGVTTGGANTLGGVEGSVCEIKWEEDYTLRSAHAITYRLGYPLPHQITINGQAIIRDFESQFGDEIEKQNPAAEAFAVHILDLTDEIAIDNELLIVDLPVQPILGNIPNEGYWGVHVVVTYESPTIQEPVCLRIYSANQTQEAPQVYSLDTPNYFMDSPVLLSIYADRLSESSSDRSRVILNTSSVGDIWTTDLFTGASTGVQGTFYYENGVAQGLNGDSANNQMFQNDGIAIVNDFFIDNVEQTLELFQVEPNPNLGNNIHAAFLLVYTPECEVSTSEIPRSYSFCRGDTVQLESPTGFDTFLWSDADGLSDPTAANPLCFADTSRWYTLTASASDGGFCDQTIPVFVEVYDIPKPRQIITRASVCPANTGVIEAIDTPGDQPITYSLGGVENTNGVFEDLAPGEYDLSVATATGCTFTTSRVVGLDQIHEASFTASPETGYTPLEVFFTNTSTQATDYQWEVDGIPFSNSENFLQTFADSGSYEVSLIAFRLEE
ncbi:MAG: hypothetical protein MK086_14785, partial [Flavobacteriales bacterium]|nr:hypothetical protein [Flavobacteriales bacterium]